MLIMLPRLYFEASSSLQLQGTTSNGTSLLHFKQGGIAQSAAFTQFQLPFLIKCWGIKGLKGPQHSLEEQELERAEQNPLAFQILWTQVRLCQGHQCDLAALNSTTPSTCI